MSKAETPMHTTNTAATSPTGTTGEDITRTMAYLARALKAPTIGKVWAQIAEQARPDG